MNRILRSQLSRNPRDLAVFDTTTGSSFGRTRRLKLFLSSIMLVITSVLSAQVSNYVFSTGTGTTLASMTGSTSLVASAQDDGVSAVTNIGFTFNFNGTSYTQFSATPMD